MIRLGLCQRPPWRMGHMAMNGGAAPCTRSPASTFGRKIFIHINNSNPALRRDQPRARAGRGRRLDRSATTASNADDART